MYEGVESAVKILLFLVSGRTCGCGKGTMPPRHLAVTFTLKCWKFAQIGAARYPEEFEELPAPENVGVVEAVGPREADAQRAEHRRGTIGMT